jgi:hypothetical protein
MRELLAAAVLLAAPAVHAQTFVSRLDGYPPMADN